MITGLLRILASFQDQEKESPIFGNYVSQRYHRILPIRRHEDNIYFVAWINQLLKRYQDSLSQEELEICEGLISRGEKAISGYGNRYGDLTYNFYRPKSWFPNGRFLNRWVLFQPTDDSDDTSMAMRGRSHDLAYAKEIKKIYQFHANGKGGRWIKRIPKKYRHHQFYSTWIGSPKLYVDLDLVVICNILMFSVQYGLALTDEDKASLKILTETIASGDYLTMSWSLSAWYPSTCTILYSIADLLATGYFTELENIRTVICKDILDAFVSERNEVGRLLLMNAMMKLEIGSEFHSQFIDIEHVLRSSRSFSFGVIPLLHPFNGIFFQFISKFDMFRMYYQCDAQCVAILIENELLKAEQSSTYLPDEVADRELAMMS